MTARVDTLAAMDAAANVLHPTRNAPEHAALTRARLDVALLMEAADTAIERLDESGRSSKALRSALAHVRGEA